MMNPEITTSLQSVFDRIFKEKSQPISSELSAKDIDGWDSFTHLNLIQEIETEFKIEFKLKELMNMNNVGDIIKIIENKFN
jgi:acyl carrier protein